MVDVQSMAPTPAENISIRPRIQYRLPAVMMRSGTSKGLFLHRRDLPESVSEWSPILLAAMGSSDSDMRQLDGVGGATSTTSKVVIVSKSNKPGIDVDYTFVQVAVGRANIDMTGNCGNMSSGVAGFALDEGLVKAEAGQKELSVRIFNTNTQNVIVETIQVSPDGGFCEDGTYQISGVKSTGSPIRMTFENPAGSMTGKLFPTGNRQDSFLVQNPLPSTEAPFKVTATLIDSANPFIFIDSTTLPEVYHHVDPKSETALEIVEAIRRQGAVLFGLADSTEMAALVRGTPKIAILSSSRHHRLPDQLSASKLQTPDIDVLAFSMGKVHPSLQLTGAVCLGSALSIQGTVATELMAKRLRLELTPPGTPPENSESSPVDENLGGLTMKKKMVIAHRSGHLDALVEVVDGDEIKGVTVFRTARRLFEGHVLFSV